MDGSWRSRRYAVDAGLCLRPDDPVAPPWPWWMQLLPRHGRGADPCYSVPRRGARSRLRPDLRPRTPMGDRERRARGSADGGGGGGGRALTRARARSAAAAARRQSTSATGSIIVDARSPKLIRSRIYTGGRRVPVSVLLLGGVGAREGGRPRWPGEAGKAAGGWVEP
jgi:hypothetical protein